LWDGDGMGNEISLLVEWGNMGLMGFGCDTGE